jgi:ergothioneine biosynthesis protein EgtB
MHLSPSLRAAEPAAPSEDLPLVERFLAVRHETLSLCEPLQSEDFVVQSMPDASPAKWHLAHTAWFFEEFVLAAFQPDYKPHDARFGFLFNSYYQAVGPMHSRAHRGLITRPGVAEVMQYRAQVDARVVEALERSTVSQQLQRVVTLGLNHEQQHQELLLTDIKHLLSCNPLHPAYARHAPVRPYDSIPIDFVPFEGGLVAIGHEGRGFSFDNETPRHHVYLRPFRLANRLITNGEYRAFIEANGYGEPAHWLSDGWATVRREGWTGPLYWSADAQSEFTLGGERALSPHDPVCHLSYYEADAFARWAGARLPTEAEWEIASASAPVAGNFLERRHWHPLPAGGADSGLSQMFGDAWEWTQSPYSPYPGFEAVEGALGEYNGKFMVNQMVLRGGSCASPQSHLRRTYRNFFYPTARWQFSGLRLAQDS